MLKGLLWKHHIDYEYLYGLRACTENVEYSLHIPEDIKRHSTPDNYWCYMYERQVKFYKQQTTNMKSLCKTFSDRAAQLHFVQSYLQAKGSEQESANLDIANLSQKPVLLQSKSLKVAVQMKEFISQHDLSPDLAACYESGIMLGAPQFVVLSSRQLQDIRHWISVLNPGKEIPENLPCTANSYPRILKVLEYDFSTVFRTKEYVLLSDYDQPKEWLMQISDFLVYGPLFERYYQFVDGTYFVAKTVRGEVVMDEWTNQPWMVRRQFERLRVQPMKLLCRKVMVYPDIHNSRQYLTIDPDGPVEIKEIAIPVYPKVHGVAKFSNNPVQYMIVTEATRNIIKGYKMRQIRGRNPRWVKDHEAEVHPKEIICTVQYTMNCGCFQLHL